MPVRWLLLTVLLLAVGCDSSPSDRGLFEDLEGDWTTDSQIRLQTIRVLPEGRYEFVSGGGVIEEGRFGFATRDDGEDISDLIRLQFDADGNGSGSTFFEVTRATPSALSLQRCLTDCENVIVHVYRRQPNG